MQMITHHLWLKALEEIGENLVNWFSNNELKLSTDKCHLLLNIQEPNAVQMSNEMKESV